MSMAASIEPPRAEAVPVTLARIEGMIGGVAKDITNLTEKLGEIRGEVVRHREQIGVLQSDVQQIRSDQASAAKDLLAADKAREDTAAALEKQTADMVTKAKAAVDQSAQRWSPVAKFYATLAAIAAVAAILFYLWSVTQ
jgi:chromosome segregation ATPase